MHPQLEAHRFHSCQDFIEALDKCHHKEYYKRIFGICNNEKDALSRCLKQASLENKERAVVSSRVKRSKIEEKWKAMDEEEYGEDQVLKILMQRVREGKIQRKVGGKDDTASTTATGL